MISNDFVFYDKDNYYRDLVIRINQTKRGDSVALATMNFDPDFPGVQAIVDASCAAANRGVNVQLLIDAYNFLATKNKLPGPMWYAKDLPRRMPAYYVKKLDALERLKACGGHYTVTNMPARPLLLPFAGRSHIKFAAVHDYVYVGGCNLNKLNIDSMVGWRDKDTAKWLQTFADDVHKTKNVHAALKGADVDRQLDEKTELLIDAGARKRSIIYDEALELIDQAEDSVFITCQFFPNSATNRHLVEAHRRGARVTVIFNHPWQHGAHYPLQQAVVWRERARTPAVFFANQLPRSQKFLHAKVIATEKGAIIGSHNYVPAGVNWGTAEIALLRRDPAFALQAVRSIKDQLT